MQGAVYAVAFDAYGEILASGNEDGSVNLWEPQSDNSTFFLSS